MWINESNIVKWCKRSCLQWKFRGAAAVVPLRRGYVRSQLVLPDRNEFGKTLERLALGHLMSPEVQNGHNDVRRYLQSWKLSATECFIRKHVASNKTPVARRMCSRHVVARRKTQGAVRQQAECPQV